jgi:UDP-N-acetylglucosamine 2-epimerase
MMTSGTHLIIGRRGTLTKDKISIAIILGIRPDIVRAAKIISLLKSDPDFEVFFIWSGQHYSKNLKDSFLEEFGCPRPDFDLDINTLNDGEIVGSGIAALSELLITLKPESVIFLGDTNTVGLSVAALINNIPIIHIEGCMRSFDFEMPEERLRRMIDHISSRIYAYLPRYQDIGEGEGLSREGIVVTGNLAVDAVKNFMSLPNWAVNEEKAAIFREGLGLNQDYLLLTCHRRENIARPEVLKRILSAAASHDMSVLFPASYKTQENIKTFGLLIPENIFLVDPLEYSLFLPSLLSSKGVLTDSGTVVEEAAILGIPSIQLRRSTERPEVYWSGASRKFDPHDNSSVAQFNGTSNWKHGLGDGKSSERIVQDLKSWHLSKTKFDLRVGKEKYINEAWG